MKLLILFALFAILAFDFGDAASREFSESKTSPPLRAVRAVAHPVNEPKEALETSESAYYPYPYIFPYYYPAHYRVVLVG
ncbi:hypothetical protein QE152_g3830 [Popillia japonica]|uniref:Uncharacterized protein n=1 Tax=Popillia japonica TaxID=7064 RepID=A0AAW1N3B3_POPJA